MSDMCIKLVFILDFNMVLDFIMILVSGVWHELFLIKDLNYFKCHRNICYW